MCNIFASKKTMVKPFLPYMLYFCIFMNVMYRKHTQRSRKIIPSVDPQSWGNKHSKAGKQSLKIKCYPWTLLFYIYSKILDSLIEIKRNIGDSKNTKNIKPFFVELSILSFTKSNVWPLHIYRLENFTSASFLQACHIWMTKVY